MTTDASLKERRVKFSRLLAEELSACQSGDEQELLLREVIKVGIGAYTLRFRDQPPAAQHECIQRLDEFIVEVLKANAFALMYGARK